MEAPIPPPQGAAEPASLPTLPHSLLHEVCHYLWPGDVARLAAACKGLGVSDATASLVGNGLAFFRPSHPLPAALAHDLILHRLPALKGLRTLDLSSAELTPGALLDLGRLAAEEGAFQSVRVLGLWDNGLGDEGAAALAQALEMGGFRRTLEGLYVRANQVDEDPSLFQVLTAGCCQALTRLSFAQNCIGSVAAGPLGRALASTHLKRLRKLDLHLNGLGDKGTAAVAEGLAAGGGMPYLDEVYLGFNGVGDAGARAVADVLWALPACRELDLGNNQIGDDGALALAIRLSTASSPHSVGSAVDDEGEEGAGRPAILKLETLDLRANRIGNPGACAFRDFLAACSDGDVPAVKARCPRLSAVYLDDNRAVRSVLGRDPLQAMADATGIAFLYTDVY